MVSKLKLYFSVFYTIAFLGVYGLIPLIFAHEYVSDIISVLFSISLLGTFVFLITLNFPKVLKIRIRFRKVVLDYKFALFAFFGMFFFVVFLTVITAPTIPIIESIRGADQKDLSIARDEFLKARTGIESLFNYILGFLTTTFIPYLIAFSYLKKYKYRHYFALAFLLYSISFLEKAYFLKIAIPLFIVFYYQSENKKSILIKSSIAVFSLFMLMFAFSGYSSTDEKSTEAFFSTTYGTSGPLESLIWRALVVPIVTALDGVRVFMQDFNSSFFYGKTSSFIAYLTGREQLNFERYLYQTQFGGSEFGNSNQFYGIEAYINFGYFGVILFSIIIALIIRWAINTKDVALISIMPLLIYNCFNAGLIANLLSNGYLFIVIFLIIFKFK